MQATASAFARGFVEAVNTCDPPRCTISVEVITESTEEVLVKAASEALASQCAGAPLPLLLRFLPLPSSE